MQKALIIIFFLGCFGANAQLRNAFFWNQYALINPAMSGIEYQHFGLASYREEQSGKYLSATGQYNTILKDRHGLGINYAYDERGLTFSHAANLNYNYQHEFDNKHASRVSLGLALGYLRYTYNYDIITFTYNTGDLLPIEEVERDRFNLNMGAAYKDDRFLFGVGVRHLYTSGRGDYYGPEAIFYGIGRFTQQISTKCSLIFESLLQVDRFNFGSTDWSIRVRLWDKLTTGLNARDFNTFGAHIQYDIIDRIRIGYSFEYFTTTLSSYRNPTHEVILGIKIP